MNIYKTINEITLYIEDNIEKNIDYDVLAKKMGTNTYTMQKIFSVLTGIPLGEYIRKRKLSRAAFDLLEGNSKVIDIAIKYGYDSATSFSRAFESYHGFKPSHIKKDMTIKDFSRIIFDENIEAKTDIEYSVTNLPNMTLYGTKIDTDNLKIRIDAPNFFIQTEKKYIKKYGPVKYAMTEYSDDERMLSCSYYCLYDKEVPGLKKIEVPESRYLKFTVKSQEAKDIQEVTNRFYREFLPSCKYDLKGTPELEYYHDEITDFYIPIY